MMSAKRVLAEQYRLQGVVRSGFDGMEVEVAGGKFNLTDVAARVGLGQLPHLAQFNAGDWSWYGSTLRSWMRTARPPSDCSCRCRIS